MNKQGFFPDKQGSYFRKQVNIKQLTVFSVWIGGISAVNMVVYLGFTLLFKAAVKILSSAKKMWIQLNWKSKPRESLAPEWWEKDV